MVRHMRIRRSRQAAIALLLLAAGYVLYAMGRPPICTCGFVKLWEGGVNSSGNSQHLTDWYSFSHVIHGMIFYALLWRFARHWRRDTRLVLAVLIEAAWEIAENSPFIIDRYRTATLAYGYTGDSILNSLSDVVMMAAGFLFASRAPAWLTVLIAIAFELFTLWTIRDNLSLNVLMLVWPVEAIKTWQSALH